MKTLAAHCAVCKLMKKDRKHLCSTSAETYTGPNENSKPVIHCTSTMETALNILKVLHPILQKCLFRYPVTWRCSSSKSIPLRDWSKRVWHENLHWWKFTLTKISMRTMKHVAEIPEIIHSTLNVRKKNILVWNICNKGAYTFFTYEKLSL